MLVLKFGGTSLADAQGFCRAADIIEERAQEGRVAVVVSAVAGVSNKLAEGIRLCAEGGVAAPFVMELRKIHEEICIEISKAEPKFNKDSVMERIGGRLQDCTMLLKSLAVCLECPDSVYCRLMGMGERMSHLIMAELLASRGADFAALDSEKYVFTSGRRDEGEPDYALTKKAFASAPKNRVLLMAGFISAWRGQDSGKFGAGLLGRNGSDFSAAIAASCLGAEKVEFWSDVDGIFTADPRVVPDAILVEQMSYEEAMELSFFGSKVLHPKTLSPLLAKGIEAVCRNSLNPAAKGTRICRSAGEAKEGGPVRGISCLNNAAVVSVSGSGMKGRKGTASRIFAAVSRAGISVLLITQSSSEYTISFCVRQEEAAAVRKILDSEFALEIQGGLINPAEVKDDCAIVSIVGDQMRQNSGVAATFFSALASRSINILAIAQGSAERSISAVIAGANGEVAVRIAHRFFFNTAQSIEVFAFGTGSIGGALLDQIALQQKGLAGQKIEIKVLAVANSKGMILNPAGIALGSWRKELEDSKKATSLDEVLDFVREHKPLNPVFVDCSASYDLPERYIDILEAGMHIATPNKRANSMSMEYYRKIRRAANRRRRRFLYETNVGAGLPIIDTLQTLFKSGDRLTGFEGIMSGSLSYIFGRLDEGAPFSQAVLEARQKNFTEPDPRDDLSGTDVARKALIIAREAGLEIELDDVEVRRVFPPEFDDSGSTEQFLQNLPKADEYFARKMEALKKEGKVLRMGASISGGRCVVGILEVDSGHPLYGVRGGENAFVFTTERYSPIPLTVRGYGAGAGVTAAGVFGDIMRTVSFNPESRAPENQ